VQSLKQEQIEKPGEIVEKDKEEEVII